VPERDRDGGVSEALGDDFGVDAGLQRQGGVRVAQVMQADARQHRLFHRLLNRPGFSGGSLV
jgi:hypothetical protein